MTSDYEYDDRTDDDMASPYPVPEVQVTLGDHGKIDATTDGTLIFLNERTGRSFEVGFAGTVHVMRALRELALAGEEVAYLENQAHRAEVRTARRDTHPSTFAVLTQGVAR